MHRNLKYFVSDHAINEQPIPVDMSSTAQSILKQVHGHCGASQIEYKRRYLIDVDEVSVDQEILTGVSIGKRNGRTDPSVSSNRHLGEAGQLTYERVQRHKRRKEKRAMLRLVASESPPQF